MTLPRAWARRLRIRGHRVFHRPLLVIVIAVAGALFGGAGGAGRNRGAIAGLIGQDAAVAVQSAGAGCQRAPRGLVAGLISGVVLLVGATTVFAELQSALDRIWHVPQRAKPSGLWAVLRRAVLSFGLILGLAFLLIVSLVISAGWRPWAAGPAACGKPGR